MSYITDNPWPLIILFCGISAAAFLSGTSVGRRVSGLGLALGIGLYFLEQYLVSPQEVVESELRTMLSHFKSRDVAAIASQISKGSPELSDSAAEGLELVKLSDSFQIKSIQVTIDGDNSATAMVRANGDLTLLKNGGGTFSVPNYWKTIWSQESGQWRLAKVTRLNPVNATEMPYFSAQ